MLEGQNIILRLFREEDVDEFVALHNQYAQRGEYYPVSIHSLTTSRSQFREHGWWADDQGRMLITDRSGRMLGTIFFYKGAPHLEGYELGYLLLKPENRGRGIISEALPLFSAYLFEAKPIRRLYLLTAPGNAASQRVAQKAGYQHEGTLRQAFFLRGQYVDCESYSLLRDECPRLAEILHK